MSIIEDGIAKVLAGKTDEQLAREAHAHLWIAYLFAPDTETEEAIERVSRIFVAKWGHRGPVGDFIRSEAGTRLIAYDAITNPKGAGS